MKKFIIFLIIFFISLNLFSQVNVAKIAFVNLYSDKLQVRLGEENNYVFITEGIDAFSSTYFVKTTSFGNYTLYFKFESDKNWEPWVDENNYTYECPVERGKNYFIVIGKSGYPSYYSCSEDKTNSAKICFLNGSDDVMSRMEISNKWKDNVMAYTVDLDVDAITNFVSIGSGNYSLFWQTPEQKYNDNYYYYPAKNNRKVPEVFSFANGKYYLFLAYTYNGVDYAVLYNITPTK